ncbi:MAG: hypothetical protein Q7R39_11485 [Dehalococcoidia bacterium]|nr:hypothetical protein [Dehalococcoidia bacterium]
MPAIPHTVDFNGPYGPSVPPLAKATAERIAALAVELGVEITAFIHISENYCLPLMCFRETEVPSKERIEEMLNEVEDRVSNFRAGMKAESNPKLSID